MKKPEPRQLIYRCKPAEDYPKEEMDEYVNYLLDRIENLQNAIDGLAENRFGRNESFWPNYYKKLLVKEETL